MSHHEDNKPSRKSGGNRLTRTVNGVTETYAYDDGDKLLTVSIGASVVKTFGYDAAGRTTTVLTSAGTTTFAYDFESRATSITGPGISQTNVYNGLDTRIGSTTNSVAQTYLRDGAYVTDPVLKDSSATYTPGVSERRGSATTFLHSGLKNADAQTGTAQTVSATRRYDAFGNVVTSTGIWNGPFGYAGGFGYQEDATGLKLLGHRYYDSSTGRFLTRDPQKDGRNWYTYCENDPILRVDSNGRFWILVAVAVIAVGVGIWAYHNQGPDEKSVPGAASDGFGPPSYQAPSGSGEIAGGGDAAIKGVGTIAPARYRFDAYVDAIDNPEGEGNRDADEHEQGRGRPIYENGEPRPLYTR